MHDRDAGARVFEIVTIVVRRQQRIDHRDHCANTRRAKPGPDKLRTIRQNDQNAIFDIHSEFAQRIARSIRHPRRFAVGVGLISEIETDFVFAPFLQIVIEEVIGHVEAFRKFNVGHALVHSWPGKALRPRQERIHFVLIADQPFSHFGNPSVGW